MSKCLPRYHMAGSALHRSPSGISNSTMGPCGRSPPSLPTMVDSRKGRPKCLHRLSRQAGLSLSYSTTLIQRIQPHPSHHPLIPVPFRDHHQRLSNCPSTAFYSNIAECRLYASPCKGLPPMKNSRIFIGLPNLHAIFKHLHQRFYLFSASVQFQKWFP